MILVKGIDILLSAPPAGGSEKQMNLLFSCSLDNNQIIYPVRDLTRAAISTKTIN